MYALWHKKQQEEKELAEAEADEHSYLNSQWANPKVCLYTSTYILIIYIYIS